ncbi:hypothetical protein V6N13_061728 [Hibiscus sabdariffa]
MADHDGLEIYFSPNNDVPAVDQKNLFEVFKLSETVKNLSIRFYGGAAFPNWLGNPSSMKNITSLLLTDCSYCELLPPLGQLSLLEHLVLENFSVVAIVGHEFFRSDVTDCKLFQSLKTLKFERMPEWEDWELLEEEAGVPLPCLQELYLINCPKLEGDLPKFLPSLLKLVISNCPQLAAAVPRTPPRCIVTLQNCDKVLNRGDYV